MRKGTGLRPYKNKRDASEGPIVEVLRKAGALVFTLDKPCDLLVCYHGIVHLIEVKSGKRGKLTKTQEAFRSRWPVTIIRDVDEALATLNAWHFAARHAA